MSLVELLRPCFFQCGSHCSTLSFLCSVLTVFLFSVQCFGCLFSFLCSVLTVFSVFCVVFWLSFQFSVKCFDGLFSFLCSVLAVFLFSVQCFGCLSVFCVVFWLSFQFLCSVLAVFLFSACRTDNSGQRLGAIITTRPFSLPYK